MSVIAWDGKTVAADKRATCAGVPFTTTKLRRLPSGEILGWTGEQDAGEMLAKWYADGADTKHWPEFQSDKDMWCRLIVVGKSGVRFYERQPVPVLVEDRMAAWGSGRDFALAAMYLGKSAREAVEVAIAFDTGCGNGIDEMMPEKWKEQT